MKTAKLIIGIISIVLSIVVIFQSCAAGLGDAIMETGGSSGASGVFVSLLMLISGIVAIATRKSKGGAITCTIMYAVAGITGVVNHGIFADLMIWGVICLIFAVVFLISVFSITKEEELNDTNIKMDN